MWHPKPTIAGAGYAQGVALLACPFCRTLYAEGESSACPECGLALVALTGLPPSQDALAEENLVPRLPEDVPLPWLAWRHGRGLLLLCAAVGLLSFFLPWVELTFPEHEFRSGFDLARGRAGWLWGGAVGWLVLVPLVLSRRTITAMRGVRPITAVFCAMTLVEVIMLVLVPPTPPRAVPMTFDWAFGLWVSGAASAVGSLAALFFGGALPPLSHAPESLESSSGKTLH
jgi:hypothetical protein